MYAVKFISLTISVVLIMEVNLMVLFCITAGAAEHDYQNTTCKVNISVPGENSITYVMRKCSRQTTKGIWFWKRRVTRYFFCPKKRETPTLITRQTYSCCEGYQNITGTLPCNSTTYGDNCTLTCPCVAENYDRCDMNGTCSCLPGWIGDNCSESCEAGKYGASCQRNCYCENNATCNHITGKCDCSSVKGWTGDICEDECPDGFYGPDCSVPCNCSDFHDPKCHPLSGLCVCKSGKRGENCSLECGEYSFGPNCEDTCDCTRNNSWKCNSSNGDCECKAGWVGDKCEQRCDPFHFGDNCSINCPCKATHICDNINGTCSSANICFSEFSLNCLSSFTQTCEVLNENCTDSDAPEPSLIKDMLDICCETENSLNISLCIAEGDCNCRSDYGGKACNETVLPENIKGTDQQKPNGVSSVVVAIVIVISVLVTATVVVIAMLWKRKGGLNKKQQNNKSIHNQGYGNTVLDNVEGQRPEHRPQDENQSEMYTLNRGDVNNYKYDVSVSDSRNKKDKNYSTTSFGETYDHLERNSSNSSNNREDTYSHAQQNSSNSSNNRDDTYSHAQPTVVDEYDTAGSHRVPSDSVYDHTDTQLYSNTTDPKVQGTSANDEYILG